MRRSVALAAMLTLAGIVAMMLRAGDLSVAPSGRSRSSAEFEAPRRAVGSNQRSPAAIAHAAPDLSRILTGVVQDADGAPVGGATVSVVREDPAGTRVGGCAVVNLDAPLAVSRTAEDGTFAMRLRTADNLAILARMEGFCPTATFVRDGQGTSLVLVRGELHEFKVLDESSNPVVGATLAVFQPACDSPANAVLVADVEGHVRAIAAAGSRILVRAEGFASVSIDASVIDNPQTVVLRRGWKVAGQVLDRDGRPLPDALVVLVDPQGDEQQAKRVSSTGAFAFDGLDARGADANCWQLDARLAGWASTAVGALPGKSDVRIVMRPAGRVRGLVIRPDGAPAAGAVVWTDAVADAAGRFECSPVWPGHRQIWAEGPSSTDAAIRLEGSAWIDVPDGQTVDGVRIQLRAAAARSYVRVRVLTPLGQPAAAATARAWVAGTESAADTDERGYATIVLAAQGGTECRVTASWTGPPSSPFVGRLDASAEMSVATRSIGPIEAVDLRLAAPGRLRLQLVDPAGSVIPFDPACVTAPKAFSLDGACVLHPDERLVVRALVPGFAVQTIVLDPPHPLDQLETVRLVRGARAVGRLVYDDGRPVTGAVVHIRSTGPGRLEESQATADRDGRFEFNCVPPGPAVLRVYDEKIVEARFERVLLAAGSTIDLGDLVLSQVSAVRGVVVDDEGSGLYGARVEFVERGGDFQPVEPTCTRDDGSFEATAPSTLLLSAVVQCEGHATRIVDLEAGLSTRIALGLAGRLRVRMSEVHDPGWRDVRVRIVGRRVGWKPRLARYDDPEVTDEDGVSLYVDLPPGLIEVVLYTPSRERVKLVTVVIGKTVDCDF